MAYIGDGESDEVVAQHSWLCCRVANAHADQEEEGVDIAKLVGEGNTAWVQRGWGCDGRGLAGDEALKIIQWERAA